MGENNSIKIYFGKVHSIKDNDLINRCQVIIPGKTDELEPDNLPWYFPWYGVCYLPQVGDTVSVIVMENNFTTAFYGNKLDLVKINLDGIDYENYLEIFKREVDGAKVYLGYINQRGIELQNDKSVVTIKKNSTNIITEDSINTQINQTKSKLELGNDNLQPILMSDSTISFLGDILNHIDNLTNLVHTVLIATQSAAMGNPMTMAMGATLTPATTNLTTLTTNIMKLKLNNTKDKLASKKIYNGI